MDCAAALRETERTTRVKMTALERLYFEAGFKYGRIHEAEVQIRSAHIDQRPKHKAD